MTAKVMLMAAAHYVQVWRDDQAPSTKQASTPHASGQSRA